jgi:hypothetical protein
MATYFTFNEEPEVDREIWPPPFFYPPTEQWLVRDLYDGGQPYPEASGTIELTDEERDAAIGPKF